MMASEQERDAARKKFLASVNTQPLTRAQLTARAGQELGWVKFDMPGRASLATWEQLLGILGEGHYRVTRLLQGDGWRQGSFLISPEAARRMIEFEEDSTDG